MSDHLIFCCPFSFFHMVYQKIILLFRFFPFYFEICPVQIHSFFFEVLLYLSLFSKRCFILINLLLSFIFTFKTDFSVIFCVLLIFIPKFFGSTPNFYTISHDGNDTNIEYKALFSYTRGTFNPSPQA